MSNATTGTPKKDMKHLEEDGWMPIETCQIRTPIIGLHPNGKSEPMWWEDFAWVARDSIGCASFPTHWKPADNSEPKGPYSPNHKTLAELDVAHSKWDFSKWDICWDDKQPLLKVKK